MINLLIKEFFYLLYIYIFMIESRKLLKKQVNKSRKFVKRTDYLRKSFKNKDQKKKNKQKKSQKKSKLLGGMIEVDQVKLEKMKKSRNCKIDIVRSAMRTIHSGSRYKPYDRKNELEKSLLEKIDLVQDEEKTFKRDIIKELLSNLNILIQLVGDNQEIRTDLEEQLTTVKEKLEIKDEDLNTDTLIEEIMDEIKEVVAQYVSQVTTEVKENIRQLESIKEIVNIEPLLEHLPAIQIEIVDESEYQLQNIQEIIDFLFRDPYQCMKPEYVFELSYIKEQVDAGLNILIAPKIREQIEEIKTSLEENKETLMRQMKEKEENKVNLIKLVLDNYDISKLDLPIFIDSLNFLRQEISELIDLQDVNGEYVKHQLENKEDYNGTLMLEAFKKLEVQVLKTNVLSQLTSFDEKQLEQLYLDSGIFAPSYYMSIHQSLISFYNETYSNMTTDNILSMIQQFIKNIFQGSVNEEESLMPVELKESIRKALQQAKKEENEEEESLKPSTLAEEAAATPAAPEPAPPKSLASEVVLA